MPCFLITGGAGFIGSNIVKECLEQGFEVRILDNLSHGKRSNLLDVENHKHFDFIEGDIRDIDICKKACDGVDYVLHQAALGSVPRSLKEPFLYHDVNIGGTLNMLEASRLKGVKRFIFASSSSVYGDSKTLPKTESMTPNPLSPYAISKITGEYYCNMYYKLHNLSTLALRYFNVFGPLQDPHSPYAAVIPLFMDACRQKNPCAIFGDGEQTRDFTYIKRVVAANLASCTKDHSLWGTAINVGQGDRISVKQLAELISKQFGP